MSFKKENGMDLRKQRMPFSAIKEEAEKAKIALSSASSMRSTCRSSRRRQRPKHISMKLTRAKMEQLCDDYSTASISPVHNCLKDGGVATEKIDELVLVGACPDAASGGDRPHLVNKPPHRG